MILILGSSFDGEPNRLAACLADYDARVVTPRDLSKPGWRLCHGRAAQLQAAVGDQVIPASAIDAVVTLLPCVSVPDLPHIAERDRVYVANEMSAFLLAWLTALDCPVVDLPSPRSLCGCGRWPSEWLAVARSVGVPTPADPGMPRSPGGPDSLSRVTLVGGRAPGGDAIIQATYIAWAEAVAEAAGCDLVTLLFTEENADPVFVGASVRPEAGSQPVADAIVHRFLSS